MQLAKIVCPDCKSKEVVRKAQERITESLFRSYWDCQCCHARLRVFEENKQITDVQVTAPNQSPVNLVLLAIDRMTRAEQTQLMQALKQLHL